MAVLTSPLRVRFVTLVCCLALAVPAGVGPAVARPRQDPRDTAPPPPPGGTSRISGHVVAADNGAPVKRAAVNLAGRSTPPGGRGAVDSFVGGVAGSAQVRIMTTGPIGGGRLPTWSQVTDDTGRVEFGDLPAGVYAIMVSPRSGFVRPQRPHLVEVDEGKTATFVVPLERTGAITGRLLDEGGDPIARARVTALRRERAAGGRLMQTGSGASTDDLGQFRLFDLPAGEYFVSGSDSYAGPMNAASPGQGYAPTYFPGSASLDMARAVVVKSAQDTPGIEFSLVRVAMGRVTGTVRDSNGQVVTTRANISVQRRSDEAVGFGRSGYVRPDGTFTITEIPPGEYYAVAMLTIGDGPNTTREGAYVPVSVNGDDVTIDIRTNTGATVKGRVLIEGTPPPVLPTAVPQMQPDITRIMVQARPAVLGNPLSMVSGNQRPVNPAEDGTFEMTGLRGPVLFTASGARLALRSVMRGGQEMMGSPVEFRGTERIGDVSIVMTYDVGSLEGLVTDERGNPAPGARIVIFPEDEDRWFPGSPFIHVGAAMPEVPASMRPPATAPAPGVMPQGRTVRVPGSFMYPSLLPGRWLVVALPAGSTPASDRESLEQLRPHAVVATVTAGSTATVQLRALKTF